MHPHPIEKMKAEILIGVLWVSMVTAQKKSQCKWTDDQHVEAAFLEGCLVTHRSNVDADVECSMTTKPQPHHTLRRGILKAVATSLSKILPSLDTEVISGACLSLRSVRFECCHELLLNETSSHFAHVPSDFRQIVQFNEFISAELVDCARHENGTSCSLRIFSPFVATEGFDDKRDDAHKESQDICRAAFETNGRNISDVPRGRNVNFPKGTDSLFQILKNEDTLANASRVVFFGCSINTLTKHYLSLAPNLLELEFRDTPLKRVADDAFKSTHSLKKLAFLRSKLSSIPDAVFSIGTLQTLRVKNTLLESKEPFFLTVSPSPLRNNSITDLNLKGTPLNFLADRAFCNFPLLENLNLQRCSLRAMYGSPFICLERLIRLKLKNNELTTLTNETFQGLVSLTSLKLTKNRIVFYDATPIFAPLVSLDVLHLGENMIDVLFPELFVKLPVSKLTLATNYISKWSPPIFSRMANLDDLRLDGNKIRVLDEEMYNDVTNLTSVRICYNPWDCTDCNIKYVALLLLETARNHCCADCVVCSENQGPLSNVLVVNAAPGTEQACIPPDYYVIVGVPLIMLLLVGSVTGYAVYRYRWYIRYFLLFLRVKVNAYRRLRAGDRFLWDAFVSYHSSDAEWVRENIVPTLESTDFRFRLCVAERDFIPGLPIVENVCRSISQSRKTLFVLSKQFAESRWCMFELTLAQHRLFESDRENQMAFIRREQMDESSLSPLLSYLFRTKTYVQAPPEDADESVRDYFWLQLRAALEL